MEEYTKDISKHRPYANNNLKAKYLGFIEMFNLFFFLCQNYSLNISHSCSLPAPMARWMGGRTE